MTDPMSEPTAAPLSAPINPGAPGAHPLGAHAPGHAPVRLSAAEIEAQSRASLLRLIRIAFMVAFLTVAALSWLGFSPWATGEQSLARSPNARFVLFFSLGLGVVVFMVDYFTPKRKIEALVSIFVGLLCAMLATLAFSYILDLLFKLYDVKNDELLYTIKALVGIGLAYLGIGTVLQTKDDFRLVIPYVEFSKQIRGARPLVLDTSALIDGRIADIAVTGFIQSPVIVPRFVIEELQALADSQDGLKRAKGRRGLEIAGKLQRAPRLDVSVDERSMPGKAVDQMIVELARTMPAIVVTGDVGLSRVAELHQVQTLNLNDLANALKQSLVPGEVVTVRLLRQGELAAQAVGYLPDGTMIVAEDGSPRIGQTVALVVTSSLQTSAGRLIFARLVEPIGPAGGGARATGESPTSAETAAEAASSGAVPSGPGAGQSTGQGAGPGAGQASGRPSASQRPFRPFGGGGGGGGTPRNPRR